MGKSILRVRVVFWGVLAIWKACYIGRQGPSEKHACSAGNAVRVVLGLF
jgi:hypothetical protein